MEMGFAASSPCPDFFSSVAQIALLDGRTIHRHVLQGWIDHCDATDRLGGSKLRVFIVHAHHEPKSFNGAMTREATAALQAAGHQVVVSDLYAMGFNPVSDRRNFLTVKDPELLRQQA